MSSTPARSSGSDPIRDSINALQNGAMDYLSALPLEILEMIKAHLDRPAVASLRHSCRQLEKALFETFVKDLSVSFDLSPSGLDALTKFTEKSALAKHVRTLRLFSAHLVVLRREAFDRAAFKQALRTIMRALPELTSLVLVPQQGDGNTTDSATGFPSERINNHLRALLDILQKDPMNVTSFGIDGLADPHALHTATTIRVTDAFPTITSLRLRFGALRSSVINYRGERINTLAASVNLLRAFRSITHLTISGESHTKTSKITRRLSSRAPQLTHLELTDVNLEYANLRNIADFKPHIQFLTLKRVTLEGYPWKDLLRETLESVYDFEQGSRRMGPAFKQFRLQQVCQGFSHDTAMGPWKHEHFPVTFDGSTKAQQWMDTVYEFPEKDDNTKENWEKVLSIVQTPVIEGTTSPCQDLELIVPGQVREVAEEDLLFTL